jgi:hypothetical protein
MIIKMMLFGILVLLSTSSPRIGWRGIVPLHSDRLDVERILGRPTKSCKKICNYKTTRETVSIIYSGEVCNRDGENRWRVPPDTVINVSVYSVVKPKLSSLKLDPKKYTKTADPELHGYFEYTNQEQGISYEVSDRGIVIGSHRFPASRDNSLRCK